MIIINNDFEREIKSIEKDIIIFGAGRWGIRLAELCRDNGIKISCFCDENPDNIGAIKENLTVYSLDEIIIKYKNPIFILSPKDKEKLLYMENIMKETKAEYYSITYFMQNISNIKTKTVMDRIWVNRFKLDKYKNIDSDVLYVQSIDLMITEQCSLKCKDCGHLMQYYQNPTHRKKDDIFSYLDRIDEVFDIVGGIQILGGEPFMNKDVYDIVLYAQQKSSIETVHVVTNATILPDKERLKEFDSSKVDFVISDYENPKQRIEEVINILDEVGIACDYATSGLWIDYSQINFFDRTVEELKDVYKYCNTKNTSILSNGNLYICPRVANAHTLKAMPNEVFEFVNIMDDTKSIQGIQNEIRQYLYGTKYLKGCNYCNGADVPTIPKAIQVDKPLLYKCY